MTNAELDEHFYSSRILVVDDEEIDREIITTLLKAEPFTIFQAAGGGDALRIVENEPLDLVLLDLVMPNVDGFQVCRRIKQDMGKSSLPVIIVTSLDDAEARVKARECGCDDFLNKPFDPSELRARVRNMLQVRAYQEQRGRQDELIHDEVERTREQLLQVDRLATLGTLVAGVGHELNNILSALSMTIELMSTQAEKKQPVRAADLERLATVANHISTHARHLLNYGRPSPLLREKLDLRDVVRSTLDMLRVSGRVKRARVEIELPESPVLSRVIRTHIEQVLVNLMGNAEDAVCQNETREPLIRVILTEPGKRVHFRVEDNGCGIPEHELQSIFEAYYTTKPAGKGTGLGLAVVKSIVESYGGKITAAPREGGGTAMSFDLPAASSSPLSPS